MTSKIGLSDETEAILYQLSEKLLDIQHAALDELQEKCATAKQDLAEGNPPHVSPIRDYSRIFDQAEEMRRIVDTICGRAANFQGFDPQWRSETRWMTWIDQAIHYSTHFPNLSSLLGINDLIGPGTRAAAELEGKLAEINAVNSQPPPAIQPRQSWGEWAKEKLGRRGREEDRGKG